MELSGRPEGALEVPSAVASLLAGREAECVWRNQVGGLTFTFSDDEPRYIKWSPRGSGLDLLIEAERLRWAGAFTPVPEVLDYGSDADGTWMMTLAIGATNAVSVPWKDAPTVAVRAIGQGLRALHDALPVAQCPFSWSVESRIVGAQNRADLGLINPDLWHDEHHGLSVSETLALIAEPPASTNPDGGAPTSTLARSGSPTDGLTSPSRPWSTQWNYGPGWEELLLSSYGVDACPELIGYYRLLWDLGP